MSDFVPVAKVGALVGGTTGAAIGATYASGTVGAVGTCAAVAGGAVGGAVIGVVASLAAPLLGYLSYKAITYTSEALCNLLTGFVNSMIETGQKFKDLIKRTVGPDKDVIIEGFSYALDLFENKMKETIKKIQNTEVAETLRDLTRSFTEGLRRPAI